MKPPLSIWIVWLSIVMWLFLNNANAQEKRISISESMAGSPNRLLEIYETTAQQAELNRTVDALLATRRSSLPVLRQTIITGTEKQKLLSLGLLREMRDNESEAVLIKAMYDGSPRVQRRAAHTIGYLKYQNGYEYLVEMLRNTQDLDLIKSVLAGLGMLGNDKALPVIRPWLNHYDSSVRVNTAISLAALGSEEGLSEVILASVSEDNQIRREGTFGLGYFQNIRARSRLEEIVVDPKAPWKTEAHVALLRMDLATKDSQDRLKLLQKQLEHPNKAVRKWIIDEISESDTPESVKALRSISDKQTPEGKYAKRKLLTLGF